MIYYLVSRSFAVETDLLDHPNFLCAYFYVEVRFGNMAIHNILCYTEELVEPESLDSENC